MYPRILLVLVLACGAESADSDDAVGSRSSTVKAIPPALASTHAIMSPDNMSGKIATPAPGGILAGDLT